MAPSPHCPLGAVPSSAAASWSEHRQRGAPARLILVRRRFYIYATRADADAVFFSLFPTFAGRLRNGAKTLEKLTTAAPSIRKYFNCFHFSPLDGAGVVFNGALFYKVETFTALPVERRENGEKNGGQHGEKTATGNRKLLKVHWTGQ